MTTVNGKHKLVGFVHLGKAHELMNILSGKSENKVLISPTCHKEFYLWRGDLDSAVRLTDASM